MTKEQLTPSLQFNGSWQLLGKKAVEERMLLLSELLLAEQVDLEVHKVGDEMITQEIHWRVGWALGEGRRLWGREDVTVD